MGKTTLLPATVQSAAISGAVEGRDAVGPRVLLDPAAAPAFA